MNNAYDRAGNRLTQTITTGSATTVTTGGATSVTVYDYNDQNRLQDTTNINNGTTEKTSYSYDNNGNVVSSSKAIVKPADSGVNVSVSIADEGKSNSNYISLYKYDVWNELTGSSTGSNSAAYGYNGDGLRTSKTVNGQITNYLYEYNNVILEEDGQGNETARNVYGTNLLSRTAAGQTADYMYNGHGDVTALMSTTGSATAVYYYDAFGNITESSGNADNPYTYAGYQYDKETGLYYLDARMYDPTIARFMQEDTYSGEPNDPLSLNLYTYCNNDPIMYSDPTGHIQEGETPQQYQDRIKSSSNTSTNSVHVGDWVQVKADGSIITDDINSSKTIGVVGSGKWVQIYGKTSDGNYDIYYGDHGGTISASALGLGGDNSSSSNSNHNNNNGSKSTNTVSSNSQNSNGRAQAKDATGNLPYITDNASSGYPANIDLNASPKSDTDNTSVFEFITGLKTKQDVDNALNAISVIPAGAAIKGGEEALDEAEKLPSQIEEAEDVGKGVLDKIKDIIKGAGEAKSIRYSPVNPGPLKPSAAETFTGGSYTQTVLSEDTTFYRVYGGDAKQVGSYMSRVPQNGGIQSQIDLALKPEWGNSTEYVTKVIVPKGTTIYEGTAAQQTLNETIGGTGQLIGGGNQVYIPWEGLNSNWFVK